MVQYIGRPLRIGEIKIPCYVLENGTRVLSGRGMQAALAIGQGHGAILKHLLGNARLKPFISNDIAMAAENLVRFIRPGRGGKIAVGYEASILPEICNVILEARNAGVLRVRELRIAHQCEVLVRAFATVGIIALIDEATGYQEERDRDELARLLERYLSEERLRWAKMFPDEFYRQLYRLKNWSFPGGNGKRTPYVGKLTNLLVYEKLPLGVLGELRKRNPRVPDKQYRRWKHFQFLSADLGQPDLRDHLLQLIAVMRVSINWSAFQRNFARAFPAPREAEQLALPIPGTTENDAEE